MLTPAAIQRRIDSPDSAERRVINVMNHVPGDEYLAENTRNPGPIAALDVERQRVRVTGAGACLDVRIRMEKNGGSAGSGIVATRRRMPASTPGVSAVSSRPTSRRLPGAIAAASNSTESNVTVRCSRSSRRYLIA